MQSLQQLGAPGGGCMHASQRCPAGLHLRPCLPARGPQLSPQTVVHSRKCSVAANPANKPPGAEQPREARTPDQSSSPTGPAAPEQGLLQQLQARWEVLQTPQKAYTVIVALVALAALPRVLTLLVLGLERVLIGGLLAAEEVLLELLLRGGALLGLVAVLGLVVAGVYLFAMPKATK